VVPFLNGIGHIDALTRAFGTSAVLGGTLKVVTQLESDGAIRQFAPGGVIEVGEFDGAMSPRLAEITETLSVPGFAVSASADIMAAMWAKWVFIATIGAVTSVARGPIGEAAAVEGGVEFAEGVLAEAASVARASGHPLGASGFETIRSTVTAVGAPITSSLSRDLMSGRPTEVEDVLGDLVARARTLGLTVGRLEAATLTLRTHNARVAR
jgi:2-dehydropantoate 2-reductase